MNRQEHAHRLIQQASQAQMRGRLDLAERLCRASLSLHPTAEAYTFLGWTLSLRGQYERAIELCRTAIYLDPTLGNPYADIGAYLTEMNRLDEAEDWLRRATARPRRYACCHSVHYNLARIYENLGEEAKALDAYRLSLGHCPACAQTRRAYTKLIGRTN